jgi:hypothetical protein
MLPDCIKTDLSDYSECETTFNVKRAWYKASANDIVNYQETVTSKLSSLSLPVDVIECGNLYCSDTKHHSFIDSYCNDIISVLDNASHCIPQTCISNKYRVPGWNDFIKPYKQESIFWHRLWVIHGKPKTGVIVDNMRSSRREYHYAIRATRKHDNAIRKSKFLDSLLKGGRDFFSEVNKIKGKKRCFANTMNGVSGSKNIAESFATEYEQLFNSCEYKQNFTESFYNDITTKIKEMKNPECDTSICCDDLKEALSNIKSNKSDGAFNLVSDNFICAPQLLYSHLSDLLRLCLIHGHLPLRLLLSTLIPIPKDRMGDLTLSNNYRGIALSALCLKIFEYVILKKHSYSLFSSDHQFAYKKDFSTTQCTWVANEVISYYKQRQSHVVACLLDCSKAFDKVRYDILFPRLLNKGVSPVILRMLFHSYLNSQVRVKWNITTSESFNISNGVRQGAVLSPILFNVYIDDLITSLKEEGHGCWVGSQYYGVLVYADDILLLSPTVSSLCSMIKICENFSRKTGLEFNSSKTVCIHFHRPAECSKGNFQPHVYLNGKCLKWCEKVKHLGHVLSCCGHFDHDVAYRKGHFICCTNDILSEFSIHHPMVKCRLLQTYGSSFYGSSLWNLYGAAVKSLYTTWNIAIRKLMGLPYCTHTRYLAFISDLKHIRFILKRRFLHFLRNLLKSDNVLICNLSNMVTSNAQTPTGATLSRILSEYDIDIKASEFNTRCDDACMLMDLKYGLVHGLSDEELSKCTVIKELLKCVHGEQHCVLNYNECIELIEFLATE